jgi:hypothetical protein
MTDEFLWLQNYIQSDVTYSYILKSLGTSYFQLSCD